MWRGDEVAELEYVNDSQPEADRAGSAADVLPTIARLLSLNIRGSEVRPLSVTRLPTAHLVSSAAIAYAPKDALGVEGAGAGAVGYYREGDARYRLAALVSSSADKAKQVMGLFRALPGASSFAGPGEESVHVVLQAAPGGPKVGWWMTRTKGLVAGAGDEALLLDPGDRAEEAEPARLTAADAFEVLKAWIAPRPSSPKSYR